jgi:probable addiction module antidote protein
MARARDYEESLAEDLADPVEAAAYLTACYEDCPETFRLGLRDVAKARGGISKLADETNIAREHLYQIMSAEGNPTFQSLSTVLEALGVHLQFVARAPLKSA